MESGANRRLSIIDDRSAHGKTRIPKHLVRVQDWLRGDPGMSRSWFFDLSDGLAKIGFYLFRGFRNRSIANIRIALGDGLSSREIGAVARQSLRNFFRACVEIGVAVVASDAKIKAEIPIVGRKHLDAALAKGKGVLLLSAHLGNFFLVGCRIALEGLPTFVLVNQPRDGRFAELMDDYRREVRQKTDTRAAAPAGVARAHRGAAAKSDRGRHCRRISSGLWH